MRVVLNYEYVTHRFVKTAQVALKANGTAVAETKDSKRGHHIWDATTTVGQQLELSLLIPDPPGSSLGKPLLDLKQLLEVFVLPKNGGECLKPKSAAGDTCPDRFNPRLTGQLVGSGPGRRFEINADLTFLDLTDYFRAKRPGEINLYDTMTQTNPPAQSGPAAGLHGAADPPHYGGRLRILEYSGGQPVTWAVLIPPAVESGSAQVGSTLFFRPAMAEYTNTDDVSLRAFIRYIEDPTPEDAPFYSQPPQPATSKDPRFRQFPPCGWEKQVAKAAKCALFVHPFPHGANYGVTSFLFPQLLVSLCKILWADQTISKDVCADQHLGRIAIAGFSQGGVPMFKALQQQRTKIDELYLFDPNDTGANSSLIQQWFHMGGKKLRMFGGGFHHGEMLSLAKTLSSADATVQPVSREAWGGFGSVYPAAVQCPAVAKIQVFSAPTDPPSDLSQDSGFLLPTQTFGSADTAIQGTLSAGKASTSSGTIVNVVPNEAAYIVQEFLIVSRGGHFKPTTETPALTIPMATDADFRNNLSAIPVWSSWLRHQWPVVGGIDSVGDTNRGATFVGYLQSAIAASGF